MTDTIDTKDVRLAYHGCRPVHPRLARYRALGGADCAHSSAVKELPRHLAADPGRSGRHSPVAGQPGGPVHGGYTLRHLDPRHVRFVDPGDDLLDIEEQAALMTVRR
jgi:hypothetical protein